MMEFNCHNGMAHSWQPTGKRWYLWAAGDTSAVQPTSAPVAIEYQCAVCKALKQVNSGKGNDRR